MDANSNPDALPEFFRGDVDLFARQYRVDSSKTTLKEFRNLSGRPILGIFFWIGMQIGLVKLDQQILDGPRPFVDDECSADDLREPICSRLVSIENVARKLEFHSPRYSISNSTGINVHGGAIRMLHKSSRMFLQILASSSGAMIQEYQVLISATENPINIFASMNGRPGYNTLAGVRTQRKIGTTLEQLFELHNQSIVSLKGNPVCFDSFDKVGIVIDHLSNLFYTDKIERGIFMPVL